MSQDDITRCHRCGRATQQHWGQRYVFGAICDRADCRRVKEAIGEEFKLWNVRHHHPVEGHDGVPSWWTPDGEVTT